jgi:hypothetical protein
MGILQSKVSITEARKKTDIYADVLEISATLPLIFCGFDLHPVLCAHQADAAAGRHAAVTTVCAALGRVQNAVPWHQPALLGGTPTLPARTRLNLLLLECFTMLSVPRPYSTEW